MKSPTLQIGNFRFDWGSRTYVMGILNVTPDSFSGDGLLAQTDAVDYALKQAEEFIANGADILDVGGESTRPGSAAISAEEELRRVIPVIQALHKNFPNVLISIDTYKAQVAEEALKAGAKIINDVWGLRADAQLAQVAAQYQA
ncbi:MAG: dihydropteroate synthase, partial [Anaerolineales bacterium]|nr:dihydropteroate synthase [Anaerolineales bacterium]